MRSNKGAKISPSARIVLSPVLAMGSQLVVLEDDGTIISPVSDTMSARARTRNSGPGKRVTVTGEMYAKGRSQAIVMQDISADK